MIDDFDDRTVSLSSLSSYEKSGSGRYLNRRDYQPRKCQACLRQGRIIEGDQNCSVKLSLQIRRVEFEVNLAFRAGSHALRHLRNQQGSRHADLLDQNWCCALVTDSKLVLYHRTGEDFAEVETCLREYCVWPAGTLLNRFGIWRAGRRHHV